MVNIAILEGSPCLSFSHFFSLFSRFITLPGLCLQSALKRTGVRIELISDSTLYLWWESMLRLVFLFLLLFFCFVLFFCFFLLFFVFVFIFLHHHVSMFYRGGFSFVAHRWEKANNRFVPYFDPSKKLIYISYFDMNNL